jgi:hypothetical protein
MTVHHIDVPSQREYVKTSDAAKEFPIWKLVAQCLGAVEEGIFQATREQAFEFFCYARNIAGVEGVTLYIQDKGGAWQLSANA